MRNSQPSGWLHTSQTAEIAWSPFGLVRRKPWGRRRGRQRQLGAFDVIREELGICPLRCVGARRLRATGDPLELVQTTHPFTLTLFKSARIRAGVDHDAGAETYRAGVRLLGRSGFLGKAGDVLGGLVLDQPALVPGSALVRI